MRLNDGLHVLPVLFAVGQKLKGLLYNGVSHDNYLFGQVFEKREETALRVKPGIGAQFLVVRLEALDDPRDAELVVPFGAVQCSYYEINNAQMEYLLIRVRIGQLFFFFLDFSHQLFRIFVLTSHDVRNAQIGQNYGTHVQYILVVLFHQRLVEASGFLKFILLR